MWSHVPGAHGMLCMVGGCVWDCVVLEVDRRQGAGATMAPVVIAYTGYTPGKRRSVLGV